MSRWVLGLITGNERLRGVSPAVVGRSMLFSHPLEVLSGIGSWGLKDHGGISGSRMIVRWSCTVWKKETLGTESPIPTSSSLLEEEAREQVVLLVDPSFPVWVQFPLWQILRTLLEKVLPFRPRSEVRLRPAEVLCNVNYSGTEGLYAVCELNITCIEIRRVLAISLRLVKS